MFKKGKIFGALLAVLLALSLAPMAASAAMPTPTVGDAYDGVDFSAVFAPGNGLYYGAYKHANALTYDYYNSGSSLGVTYDANRTPVLWNVMGEEAGDGRIALLSRYVLDGYYFHNDYTNPNANIYDASDIRKWLNDPSYSGNSESPKIEGFLATGKNPFTTSELGDGTNGPIMASDVTTSTYDYTTGDISGSAITSTSDRFYLPWGTYDSGSYGDKNTVWWSASDGSGARPSGYKLTNKVATLRGVSGGVYYWLRSPYSDCSNYALFVIDDGYVYYEFVDRALGVRPAFKLNPSSVIFTSEISSTPTLGQTQADSDYAVGASPAKNYKLTVVSSAVALTGVSDSNGSLTSGSSTLSAVSGATVALTGTATGHDKLAYKIVDNARTIVGYGEGADATSLAVAAKDLSGAGLADGSYALYVWAQKDNAINSNEGSAPQYFTLTVGDGGNPLATEAAAVV